MNQFLTTNQIMYESLMTLRNNLQFSRYINREYSSQFGQAGGKIGSVVNARKPPKYHGRYGNAANIEDITETTVPVVCDKLFGVDLAFTDVDLKLSMDNYRKRYIEPAVARIANEVDRNGLLLYKDVYNFVGVPGVTPTANSTYLDGGVKLDNTGTPRRGQNSRNMVLGSQAQATIVNANLALFNSQSKIRAQYEDGEMATDTLGWNWSMDQNVQTHTVGALGSIPVVNGAGQTGASIVCDGASASVTGYLKQGDCITFALVFGIVPQTAGEATSGDSTGQLQQFVVTADVDSDGSGNFTVPISPSIITSGAFQTVTNSPAENAVILIFTSASAYAGVSSKQALGFHKDFCTLVTVDLEEVGGVDMMGRIQDPESGLSLRSVRAYDVMTNKRVLRTEILFGWSTVYPEMAVRVAC